MSLFATHDRWHLYLALAAVARSTRETDREFAGVHGLGVYASAISVSHNLYPATGSML